jgi:hypothetical protein
LFAVRKLRWQFSDETQYMAHYRSIAASIPDEIMGDVLANMFLLETRRELIKRRFQVRKFLPGKNSRDRLSTRRNQRDWEDSLLFSGAMWNLIVSGFMRGRSDTDVVRWLSAIFRWLETAVGLYTGTLGDPHKLAAAGKAALECQRSQVDSLRILGQHDLVADIEAAPNPAIDYIQLFDPDLLGHSKGKPQAAARAWIIRNLDTLIPDTLTADRGRYAVIADLLIAAGIPIDVEKPSSLVRNAIFSNR